MRTIRRNIARNAKKYAAKATVSAMMLAGGVMMASPILSSTVSAATEHWNDASASKTESWSTWKANWDKYSTNYENVSLTPGATESQLNFAYYSKTEETPKVKIATKADMSDAKEVEGKQTQAVAIESVQYYSNKASVNDLKENTTYYYQVFQNGKYQDVQKYSTKSFKNYSFLYVGDPQIGASSGQTSTEGDAMKDNNYAARNDSYNWNNVLNNAVKQNPNLSFVASAGDQVNNNNNEKQYAGYLGADALRSLPVATTIGNHDSGSAQYEMHYNNPNAFDTSGYRNTAKYTEGKTAAGTDYYYTYGNTLFIVLDTNNYNCATHENVMRKAIKENPNVKWKVVMFHQDIYGSGYDHSDSDGMVLRTQLTPLMDKYDIDVVLQGHDHTYSRTYQLQSDGQAHDKFAKTENTANYAKENNCYEIVDTTKGGTVVNPKGTVYLEANSATGSKFYNLITAKQDFISERSQTWTPSYSVVNVTDDSFEVTTYDADTGKVLDGSSSYKIVKKAEDTKKDDENSNTTKKDDTTVVQTKDQTITATASYKKSETSKAFKLNAKTNGNGKLTYTTSNKAVATVDAAGKVTVKGPGVAKITVKAAATTDYKAASKTVTVTVAPKKQSISLVNKIKKQLMIKWKKNTKASGYQVVYSTNKKFTGKKTVRKAKTTTSYKVKGLKKGKKYYVKVRSYKTVNGKRIYGAYSTAKKATIK